MEEKSSSHKVICPYCDYERDADGTGGDCDQTGHEEQCHECGKMFFLVAYMDITYETSEI